MDILTALGSAALGGLGVLVTTVLFPGLATYLSHRLTGQVRTQELQDAVTMDALSKAGITRERIDQLKAEYFGRKGETRAAEDKVKVEIEIEAGNGPNFATQAEMTQYAFTLTDIAEGKMRLALQELRMALDDKAHLKAFEEAQEAFMKFAQKEADASGLKVEGGSMQPMIHTMALEDLYVDRTAALQQHKKEWRH